MKGPVPSILPSIDLQEHMHCCYYLTSEGVECPCPMRHEGGIVALGLTELRRSWVRGAEQASLEKTLVIKPPVTFSP